MSLFVLDFEVFENKIVKELGEFKKGQTVWYSFLPTKIFKAWSQSDCYTEHLHGINRSSGYDNNTELQKLLDDNHTIRLYFETFSQQIR